MKDHAFFCRGFWVFIFLICTLPFIKVKRIERLIIKNEGLERIRENFIDIIKSAKNLFFINIRFPILNKGGDVL
jgi:hypothetical protein